MTFGPHPGQLGEVDPAVVARVLDSAGQRVTEINQTTRDGLAGIIADGIDAGMGPAELGQAIQAWSGWDEYRAEMIARTETGMAFNETALATYRDSGVEQVQVTDGDDDEICAPWANWTGPIDEAPEPLGHPNCTRDIMPVVTYTPEDYATAQAMGGGPSEEVAPQAATAAPEVATEQTATGRAMEMLGDSVEVRNADSPIVQQHLQDLGTIPEGSLRAFKSGGGRIVIDSRAADVLRLPGTPRGYSPGEGWKNVAGVFDPSRNVVFVGDTAPHGSTSVMLHEFGHGLDHYASISRSEEWQALWRQASLRRSVAPYYKQAGDAGPSEMWAEAFADYVHGGLPEVTKEFGKPVAGYVEDWVRNVFL